MVVLPAGAFRKFIMEMNWLQPVQQAPVMDMFAWIFPEVGREIRQTNFLLPDVLKKTRRSSSI